MSNYEDKNDQALKKILITLLLVLISFSAFFFIAYPAVLNETESGNISEKIEQMQEKQEEEFPAEEELQNTALKDTTQTEKNTKLEKTLESAKQEDVKVSQKEEFIEKESSKSYLYTNRFQETECRDFAGGYDYYCILKDTDTKEEFLVVCNDRNMDFCSLVIPDDGKKAVITEETQKEVSRILNRSGGSPRIIELESAWLGDTGENRAVYYAILFDTKTNFSYMVMRSQTNIEIEPVAD